MINEWNKLYPFLPLSSLQRQKENQLASLKSYLSAGDNTANVLSLSAYE